MLPPQASDLSQGSDLFEKIRFSYADLALGKWKFMSVSNFFFCLVKIIFILIAKKQISFECHHL